MESLEVTARTVNEAIAKALVQLGKKRDEVEVSVLSEGSRGILGIGGEDARILVSPREAQEADEGREPPEAHSPRVSPDEVADAAADIVEHLLSGMGIEAEIETQPASADAAQNGFAAYVNVLGPDLGVLIGRRGESLGAFQFITNLILGKQIRRWAKVQVDVEGYRVRREQTLRGLAQRVAARVQQTGVPFTLEAMPPNERRIIHLTLGENPEVTTASIGEGDQRRVVVSPKR